MREAERLQRFGALKDGGGSVEGLLLAVVCGGAARFARGSEDVR